MHCIKTLASIDPCELVMYSTSTLTKKYCWFQCIIKKGPNSSYKWVISQRHIAHHCNSFYQSHKFITWIICLVSLYTVPQKCDDKSSCESQARRVWKDAERSLKVERDQLTNFYPPSCSLNFNTLYWCKPKVSKITPPWKEEKEFLGVLARTFWKLFACKFWDLTTLSGQILNLLEGIYTIILSCCD